MNSRLDDEIVSQDNRAQADLPQSPNVQAVAERLQAFVTDDQQGWMRLLLDPSAPMPTVLDVCRDAYRLLTPEQRLEFMYWTLRER